MQSYEQQLQKLKESGMFYGDAHKKYLNIRHWDEADNSAGGLLNTFGYCQDSYGRWVVFVMDDERGVAIRHKVLETEQAAVEALLTMAGRNNFSYMCNKTLEHFSEKEQLLVDHLSKEYGYAPEEARRTIEYLLQGKYFAFEFAYFVEHGELVPDQYANRRSGYTVRRLIDEEKMTVLDACKFMVSLQLNPEEALAKLQ